MSEFNATTTVGDWVARYPQTAQVFEKLQIDYCCGGQRSLESVCAENGVAAELVVAQLQDVLSAEHTTTEESWRDADPARLCDHIEAMHHQFLRRELPRLTELMDKVAVAHGKVHPELEELKSVLADLRAELEPHMLKEESILFPAIRKLARSSHPPQFLFGSVANPIHMMEHEHDIVGNALKHIRELTADFQLPEDACNAYRGLLAGLQNLESDLHQHIHKENNILFPKARDLESNSTQA